MTIGQEKIDQIDLMLIKNMTPEQIAEDLNIAIRTARRYIRLTNQLNGNGEQRIKIPKILVFDIETVMMEVYVWGIIYEQRIPQHSVIKDWNVLAWSAKWLFDSKVMSDVQTPKEAVARDDKRILLGIWKLLDEADIVIAHNGDKFDIRKLNSRFIEHGMMPPMPYRSIDTLKVCRRNFAFSSFTLDYLCKKFGIGGKLTTGFSLWEACLKGDQDALDKMSEYNIRDTLMLEEFYVKIRPWIKGHPKLSLYMDVGVPICENCGSADVEHKGQYYTTSVNKFKAFRCNDCGAIGRARKSSSPKVNLAESLVSIAS